MPSADVVRRYFDAIAAHDLEAALALWAPGGVERVVGQRDLPVPDGVRAGIPKTMNVYLIEDDGGVTVFDAGVADMTQPLAAAAARLGAVKRVVLDQPAHVPHPAFNQDTAQALDSIRKLAALDPAIVWPGHADPVTGDVAAQLERAASGPA